MGYDNHTPHGFPLIFVDFTFQPPDLLSFNLDLKRKDKPIVIHSSSITRQVSSCFGAGRACRIFKPARKLPSGKRGIKSIFYN